MKPYFSIITPTYNRGYVIWKTIQSIQRQTYPDWELLVVDDGSTDNTKQVIAEFQKDPRISYLYKKHENASTARNLGLLKAKGKMITYVDSDDEIYPNYLQIALEYFKRNTNKVFATCNYNKRRELYDKNFQLVDFSKAQSAQKMEVALSDYYQWRVKSCGTGIFHTRKVIDKGIRWDKNIQMLEDLDFILEMGDVFPKGYFHIPYVLFEYLQKYGGDGVVSTTSYKGQAEGFEKIYKKHKANPLMEGQEWYPQKFEKFMQLQKLFEEGKAPAPIYRNFPNYKGGKFEVSHH